MERVARSRTENLAAYPIYRAGKTLIGIVAVVELDEHAGRAETRRFSRRNATIGESAENGFTDTAHLRGVGVPQSAPLSRAGTIPVFDVMTGCPFDQCIL